MPRMPSIEFFAPDQLEQIDRCPWCRGERLNYLFSENGFPHVQCSSCTLIFLQHRVRQEFLDLVYQADYHSHSNYEGARRTAAKRLSLLEPLPVGTRVHEDGAGSGAFVSACSSKGYVVTGNDLGVGAISTARTVFGVDLHHGSVKSVGLKSESIDAFVCFNLLSHLYTPWEYMKLVRDLLVPGGLWLLRTGNRDGHFKNLRWGAWSAPEHVFHFTKHVLAEMMDSAGLKLSWTIPAFDSDYPYFLFDCSRNPQNSILKKLAGKACSYTVLAWTLAKLPKDDVYILARRG